MFSWFEQEVGGDRGFKGADVVHKRGPNGAVMKDPPNAWLISDLPDVNEPELACPLVFDDYAEEIIGAAR